MPDTDQYIVGVDIGGTKIATSLMTVDGNIIKHLRINTYAHEEPVTVINRIITSIQEVKENYPIIGIGIGVPGTFDDKEGIVLHCPNLPGWDNLPIKSILAKTLDYEILLCNDANAAAWGEYIYGAGRGTRNIVYVTISTGIGTGLILNGEPYVGNDTYGGEYGHMTIDIDGEICSCGNQGCWEAYASGTFIGRYAREACKSSKTIIAELANKEDVLPNSKHVFEAARLGDQPAQMIFDKMVRYSAAALRNIVHTINPELIIIGGGVSNAGEPLFGELNQKTNKIVMQSFKNTFDIVQAKLGDEAGTMGAAALLLKSIKEQH